MKPGTRVVFVIPTIHGGGAEYVTRTWIGELQSRGVECLVLTYQEENITVDAPCEVRTFISETRGGRFLRLPLWVRSQVRSYDADIVVSMLTYTNLVTCLAKVLGLGRARLFISERNLASAYLGLFGRSGRAQALLARVLYRRADGLLAISHTVAADARAAFALPADFVHLVPNPVTGTRSFVPVERTRSGEAVHLVYVGRLVEQKAAHRVLDVLEELRRSGVEARATMIGAGPLQTRLEADAKAKQLDIDFAGWREPWWDHPDRPRWTCHLLPSDMEGFGNVLVEAAAAGVPSVAISSALGVSDAVVPGLTGAFAAGRSTRDLTDAVRAASLITVDTPAIEPWLQHFGVSSSVDALERALSHEAV